MKEEIMYATFHFFSRHVHPPIASTKGI